MHNNMTELILGRQSLILAVVVGSLLLLSVPASAGAGWQTFEISDPGVDAIAGTVSGDYIIYTAAFGDAINLSTPRGVFLYSLESLETRVIGNSTSGMTLTGADISGSHAVWFEEQPLMPQDASAGPTEPNRILLYSIPDDQASTIYVSENAEWPKISGSRIAWSDSEPDSVFSNITLYDIDTREKKALPGITVIGNSYALDGDYLAYQDAETEDLRLYSISSGSSTMISNRTKTDDSVKFVDSFALGGDHVIFIQRILVERGADKGIYRELYLFTISTGETRLISPLTGKFVDTASGEERTAYTEYPSADTERVAWAVAGDPGHAVIHVLDPATGDASSIKVASDVSFTSIDAGYIAWTDSTLGSRGTLVFATEAPGQETAASAPGFGVIGGLAAILALIGISSRRK